MTGEDVLKVHAAEVAFDDGATFPERIGILLALRNRAEHNGYGWVAALQDHDAVCPDVRDPEFQRVLDAVDGVFDGTRPDDLVNGATGWMKLGLVHTVPDRVAQIGQLEFYR